MNHFLTIIFRNHVLANLTFVLVLAVGLLSYLNLPRQQDPTINFNWIVITTVISGASAPFVEKKVTDPMEDAVKKVPDIKFMSSNSREGVSSILIRFEDIDDRTFDKRVASLRREIQNKEGELPAAAEDPQILEITSANAFPSATVAIVGEDFDETLRLQAHNIKKDIERIRGVDRVESIGQVEPELQVRFDPHALEALNLSPVQITETVKAFFQDIAAGDVRLGQQTWLVHLIGSDSKPSLLGARPITGIADEIRLDRVARVLRGRSEATQLASYNGRPAVMLAINKRAGTNTLDLVDRINAYLQQRNALKASTAVELILIDDQTTITRQAIAVMQNNALIGLVLVLLVAWLFLGSRIAALTAIGIPFILAGTFWILSALGETLNVMVLLGVVIVLGMLVDDAVVVVEGIYYRLQRGANALSACLDSLQEVSGPVTAAVLTTIAAFGPLVLLPGILGDFMRVVPMVVIIGLSLSLLESFWMLPAHVMAAGVHFRQPGRIQKLRMRMTHWLQIHYVRLLVKALRHRLKTLAFLILLFAGTVMAFASGQIQVDFFASDPKRMFYVNIEMPPSTPLAQTLAKVEDIEGKVRAHIFDGEARALISYAGSMFTETEPRLGDQVGQIMVGLHPRTEGLRSVNEMIEGMRDDVLNTPGPVQISFLRMAGGPPVSKPISIKVRGDDYATIRAAANDLRAILSHIEHIVDIEDDASKGRNELTLRLNNDAVRRAGLDPRDINQTLLLLADGLVVTDTRDQGEKIDVRVLAEQAPLANIDDILKLRLPVKNSSPIPLIDLVERQHQQALGNIRHYNFRRAITVEADIAPDEEGKKIDTRSANAMIMTAWQKIADRYPNVDLDASGELDDINESIDSMLVLFLAGIGVMYAILGTQFRSYYQPLMILVTVPMAFTGVSYGLLVSQNPLSLYTIYGIIALAGIAVNAAIVLISAGNARLEAGMSVLHATIYAARRRVIPILITSLTTIAGLFSLAVGLGGQSLIWGPLATAIVWGLAFSTALTLIVIPLLYRQFMHRSHLHCGDDRQY